MLTRLLYLDKLIRRRENGLVKVITGVRRCGKSFLLFEIYKDYLIAKKIENPDLAGDFITFYDVLNGLLRKKNADIYVTGSNSKMLSSDILTEFRGRGDEVRVYPLSFAEFHEMFEGEKHIMENIICGRGKTVTGNKFA